MVMDGLSDRSNRGKYPNGGCGAFITNSTTDIPPIPADQADKSHTLAPSHVHSDRVLDCNEDGDNTAASDREYGQTAR